MMGASASRSGSRPTGGAAKASPAKPSIPSAYRRDRAYGPARNWDKFYDECVPLKTCPASRHTRMITESLRDPRSPMRRLLIDAGYEPDHLAGSIEVTLACLWEARRWLEWEELPPTKRYKYNGHWVPDASAIEARRAETAGLDAKHESAVPNGQTPKRGKP
jgi:hypothetical protein